MARVKSEPRKMSPVTGKRSSNLLRAARVRSRLILINETDSRPPVNRFLQDFLKGKGLSWSPDRYLPPPRTRRNKIVCSCSGAPPTYSVQSLGPADFCAGK